MKAFVYTDGVIGFGQRTPGKNMALPLAVGPARIIRDAVYGSARKRYEKGVWLVPGVPEAESQLNAVDAVLAYKKRLQRSIEFRMQEAAATAKAAA